MPTYVQMRMKARKTPGFPSHTTLGRLGSRSEQTVKLLNFCRTRSDYEDVAKICELALAKHPPEKEAGTVSPGDDGFVYLFKSGRRYKFGFTNDQDRRIRELAHQTSEPINKVHSIRTDDPSGMEAYWKNRFRDKRVHNEWFTLSAKDVAAFKRRKKFM